MTEKPDTTKPFLLRRENRYLWFALILPAYLLVFAWVEAVIPVEACRPTYIPLDDRIPFLEGFIVPYMLWFPMLLALGLYLARLAICLFPMTHSAFFCRLYRIFCRLCYFFCRLCCLTLRCSPANHSCCLSLLSGCFRALSSLTPLCGRTQLLRLGILCGLLYNLYFPALLGFIDRCFYFSLLLSSLRRLILSSCLSGIFLCISSALFCLVITVNAKSYGA